MIQNSPPSASPKSDITGRTPTIGKLAQAARFILDISQAMVAIRYGAPWAKPHADSGDSRNKVRAYSA